MGLLGGNITHDLIKILYRTLIIALLNEPSVSSLRKLSTRCRHYYHVVLHDLVKRLLVPLSMDLLHCLRLVFLEHLGILLNILVPQVGSGSKRSSQSVLGFLPIIRCLRYILRWVWLIIQWLRHVLKYLFLVMRWLWHILRCVWWRRQRWRDLHNLNESDMMVVRRRGLNPPHEVLHILWCIVNAI